MVRKLFLGPLFHFDPNLASALALLCTYRHSLPTGSPLSPVISNFVCLGMDADLTLLARKHGYAYTRYADDLTFSGERPPEAGFFESVTRITGEYNFTLEERRSLLKWFFLRILENINGLLGIFVKTNLNRGND